MRFLLLRAAFVLFLVTTAKQSDEDLGDWDDDETEARREALWNKAIEDAKQAEEPVAGPSAAPVIPRVVAEIDEEMLECPRDKNFPEIIKHEDRNQYTAPDYSDAYRNLEIEIRTSKGNGCAWALFPICEIRNDGLFRATSRVIVLKDSTTFLTPYYQSPPRTREKYVLELRKGTYQPFFVYLPLWRYNDVFEIPMTVNPDQLFLDEVDIEHVFFKYNFFMVPRSVRLHECHGYRVQHLEDEEKAQQLAAADPERITAYKLVVHHAPSSCLYFMRKSRWVSKELCANKWMIHGLWPNVSIHRPPPSCEAKVKWEDVSEEVEKVWFTVSQFHDSVSFIDHEWCNHGAHMFKTSKDYINTTVTLFTNLRLQELLDAEFPVSHHAHYTLGEVADFIDRLPTHGRRASYTTRKMVMGDIFDWMVLEQIRFCFDLQLQPIDCEPQLVQFNPDSRIYRPPDAQIIPYLLVSLLWPHSFPVSKRSDNQAMNALYNEHGEMTWKLHSVCPTYRYEAIFQRYSRWRYTLCHSIWGRIASQGRVTELNRDLLPDWTFGNRFYVFEQCGQFLIETKNEKFRNHYNYFLTSLNLYNFTHARDWNFRTSVGNIDLYAKHEFLEELTHTIGAPGVKVFLGCDNRENPSVLAKVRLCLDLEFSFIDCPSFDDIYRPTTLTSEEWFEDCPDEFYIPGEDLELP